MATEHNPWYERAHIPGLFFSLVCYVCHKSLGALKTLISYHLCITTHHSTIPVVPCIGIIIPTTKQAHLSSLWREKHILSSNFLVADDSGDLSPAFMGSLDTDPCAKKSNLQPLSFSLNILCHLQKLNHSLQRNAARNRLLAQLSLVQTFLQQKCSNAAHTDIKRKQLSKQHL